MTGGLVAHWDGIDNTLAGGVRSHDANATTWCDLSGNGNDVQIPTSFVTVEANAMTSAADLNKTAYPSLASLNGLDLSQNTPFTVEVVARRLDWRFTDNYGNLQSVFGTPRGGISYRGKEDDGFCVTYWEDANTFVYFPWRHSSPATDIHTVTAVFGTDKNSSALYMDGTEKITLGKEWTVAAPSAFTMFGNLRADIRVHAIRVYNRVLTASERKQNRQLDCRRFRMAPSLPQGYQFVDYIESTKTQMIDTGYLPNPTTKMEADLMLIGSDADRTGATPGAAIFGCSESGRCFSMNFGGNAANNEDNMLFPWLDKTYAAGGNIYNFEITPALRMSRQTLTVDAATGVVKYGSVTKQAAVKTTTHSERSLRIFGNLSSDGALVPFTYYGMRVYGWKIWDGATLVRDFVPCYRLPEMEAGLYDKVNGEFHANVGTGMFKYGFPVAATDLPDGYHGLDYLVVTGAQHIASGLTAMADTTVCALFSPFDRYDGVNVYRAYTVDRSGFAFSFANGEYRSVYRNPSIAGSEILLPGAVGLGTSSGRLAAALIWNGDALQACYKPCYRVADGVAGMYDTVGGSFHPSDGEKPFLHGTGGECGVASFGGKLSGSALTWPENFGALTNFSFSVWVRNPSASYIYDVYGAILSQGALAGNNPGFACFTSASGGQYKIITQLRDADSHTVSLSFANAETLLDDKWHHLAFTCDYSAGTVCFYVDGKMVDGKTGIDTLIGEPKPKDNIKFMIGARMANDVGLEYRGEIAQVSLWRRALSQSEVARLRTKPVKGTEADLLEAWTLSGSAGLTGLVSGKVLAITNGDVGFVPAEINWHIPGMAIYLR